MRCIRREDRTIEYGRVPYDIGKAAAKILQAELPESLAMRLFARR